SCPLLPLTPPVDRIRLPCDPHPHFATLARFLADVRVRDEPGVVNAERIGQPIASRLYAGQQPVIVTLAPIRRVEIPETMNPPVREINVGRSRLHCQRIRLRPGNPCCLRFNRPVTPRVRMQISAWPRK